MKHLRSCASVKERAQREFHLPTHRSSAIVLDGVELVPTISLSGQESDDLLPDVGSVRIMTIDDPSLMIVHGE